MTDKVTKHGPLDDVQFKCTEPTPDEIWNFERVT